MLAPFILILKPQRPLGNAGYNQLTLDLADWRLQQVSTSGQGVQLEAEQTAGRTAATRRGEETGMPRVPESHMLGLRAGVVAFTWKFPHNK